MANRIEVPSPNLGSSLFINVSCGGQSQPEAYACKAGTGDSAGYAAVAYLYAADLTLEQAEGPEASDVGGELASAQTVSGTTDLTFHAVDPGSGVYQAVFAVDGQVVQRSVLDEDGGRCRDVGETTDGLPAFLFVHPCPATVSADVGFDSSLVGDGSHHLVVTVTDAAGNSAPVLDRTITVANHVAGAGSGASGAAGGSPPAGAASPTGAAALTPGLGAGPANGINAPIQATLAVAWKGAKGPRLAAPYGRAETILGRLTAPGAVPIAGAQIDLQATPSYAGASTAAMVSPVTDSDGRFVVRLPAGISSRTLRFGYRTHLGETTPVASQALVLNVASKVSLAISPRTAAVGQSIHFSGRVLGAPIPAKGKLLVIEARAARGRWLEFDVVRSNSHGRYHAGYRFRFPGPSRYQFRVLSTAEADYPFGAGSSNVVEVLEH